MPKLTKQLVDNITQPATGDTTVWDTELPGFGVRVHAGGSRVYVVRYRTKCAQRYQRRMTICRTCDAPPNEARAMAREVFSAAARGEDPSSDRAKKTRDSALTIQAMFEARVASMRAKDRAMAGHVERMLLLAKNNAADSFGRDRAPSTITPADVVKFVSTFYQAGHRGAADKARGYLAATFAWAIKSAHDYTVEKGQDWGVTRNPAADVAKDHGAVGVRDRNLDQHELRIFWIACQDGNGGFSESMESCLRTIMSCGQRVQETLRMAGRDIDLEKRIWRMPASKTKGRTHAHTLPLPDIIIPELQRLKAKFGDGPMFPSQQSESGLLGALAVANAVRRYVQEKDAPIKPFQPRDLRRTWKSRAHDAGVDRFTRDLLQQHAKNDTGSKNYDRADYLPQMRKAMDDWSDWLVTLTTEAVTQQ